MLTSWNEFQEGAIKSAIYQGSGTKLGLLYTILGLPGETGETAEHAKKCLRDDGGIITPDRREKILKELGDVTWYCAALAHECRLKLEDVRLSNPMHYPEHPRVYPGYGTSVGFGYLCARMAVETGKVVNYALHVMPYTVEDGQHWSSVGQGGKIRGQVKTGIGRVLYIASLIATELGMTLDFVMEENLVKLRARMESGTLGGAGSSR